jgi:hypothetical protein
MRVAMGKFASGLLVVLGMIWTVVVGWVAANTAVTYFRMGQAPRVVTPAEARETDWVRLEGARLRCDSRVAKDRFTYYLADDAKGGAPFVVQFTGDEACEGATIEGGFMPGRFTRAYLAERFGVSYPGEGDLRLFTEALAKPFLRTLLLQTLALLIPGVLSLVVGVRRMKRASPPAAPRRGLTRT